MVVVPDRMETESCRQKSLQGVSVLGKVEMSPGAIFVNSSERAGNRSGQYMGV
jgi:hypothetical protein